MERTTLLTTYLATVVACLILIIGVTRFLRPGLIKFFERLIPDPEISKFFMKLVTLILFLGGFSAALNNSYVIERANWLTLSWDSVDQVQATMNAIFGILIAYSVVFLILEFFNRKFSK